MKIKIDPKRVTLEGLYRFANMAVMPFWLLMILLPNAGLTRAVMRNNLVFRLLGGSYTAMLVYSVTRRDGGGPPDFMTLEGVSKLLSSRYGALTGWLHFLAFDLFVGRWIYFDSLERGRPARFSLFLTLMAGPLGLLFYLTFARRKLPAPAATSAI